MAVSAGFAVRLLGGDLEFTAGGMNADFLIGAFVKSIEDTGSHLEITLQQADGTEHTFTWAGGGAPTGSGWTPQLAVVSDGDRRVLQVADWEGGTGAKPATGQYVGPMGLVPDAASAVDIRGMRGVAGIQGKQGIQGPRGLPGGRGNDGTDGATGWSPSLAVVADGNRRVLQVHGWQGGTGTPPATGQYVGAAGLVSDIADAVDVRGPIGTAANSIGRLQARPDIGAPVYIASVVYDGTAHTLTATIPSVPDAYHPFFMFFVVPALDRQPDDLRLIAGVENRSLRKVGSGNVGADDLTPGNLVSVLTYGTGQFRFLEPLPPRPQDFVIHYFLFEADNGIHAYQPPNYPDPVFTLTQALVNGATHRAASTATSPRVNVPTGYTPSATWAEALEAAGGQVRGMVYAGISNSAAITSADLASAASTATPINGRVTIRFPTNANTVAWFAVPVAAGDPTANPRVGSGNAARSVTFARQAATIDDSNGIPLQVWTVAVGSDSYSNEWLRMVLPERDEYAYSAASMTLVLFLAVPDLAPDIRGYGYTDNASEGWDEQLSGIDNTLRVAGTFDIGGVAHKFIRLESSVGVDYTNDPPSGWETWNPDSAYFIMAFAGLPDPEDQ